MKIKDAFSLQEGYDKPRQPIKKQKHHFADKGPYSQNIVTYRCESWTIKKVSAEELMLLNSSTGEDS